MSDRREAGFKERTRLAAARERLRETVVPHGRTEQVPLGSADGRVLAEGVTARRDVPGEARAAMDGYAVRASDTFGAGERSPAVLRRAEDTVGPGEAVRVDTGGELPAGADAVVMIEGVEAVGGEIEVFDAATEGENVAPAGEDVESGEELHEPGHRLRPSDLGLLKAVGIDQVVAAARPTVGVIPVGSELVQSDPGPGEAVETNGLTVSRYVERWGGRATYRDVVADDRDAIRAAIQRDLTKDLVVANGGSSVGRADFVPDAIDDLGEVFVHGVALRPGHPVALGVVEETPVLALPGYPVSTIVTAVQFLRPAIAWVMGTEPRDHPSVEARLTEKIESGPGVRTFARVRLAQRDGERVAHPVSASGAGVLSTVALADGWVVIEEPSEGIAAGETVMVADWEWHP